MDPDGSSYTHDIVASIRSIPSFPADKQQGRSCKEWFMMRRGGLGNIGVQLNHR